MNYKEAEKIAKRLSKENQGEVYYVNWLEEDEYCIDCIPETDDQSYYLKWDFIL